ncbi:MAG: SUMF1/EgtB/PvdO family nonheme iron enzyme, partial [Candidatus Hydrogenedentes bacterium]|nr:SUMF1/EgtB/PvdO family nonheme iron enzyme [Candidatus Hydrogenedentota bacterium]
MVVITIVEPCVPNDPPVADAGPDQTVDQGAMVQLDGTGSSDPNNDPLTFDWRFITFPSGTAAMLDDDTSPTPAFTADLPGTYTFELIVDDGQDHTSCDSSPDAKGLLTPRVPSPPDTVVIRVLPVCPPNEPPMADAGPDKTAFVNTEVSLYGGDSTDPENDPLTYQWSVESTPPGTSITLMGADSELATFSPNVTGEYVFSLIVSDNYVCTRSPQSRQPSLPDMVTVTVIDKNVLLPLINCIFPYDCFVQGPGGEEDGDPNEYPRHDVFLSPYGMGIYEITNAEYATALNWALANDLLEDVGGAPYSGGDVYYGGVLLIQISGGPGADEYCDIEFVGGQFVVLERNGVDVTSHPVVEVTWYGAIAYCNWLSLSQVLPPAYDLNTWTRTGSTGGYRLPTESEWEYAAAWDLGPPKQSCPGYHWRYGYISDEDDYMRMNYNDYDPAEVAAPYTSPVGFFDGSNADTFDSPSPQGMYDMSGNVWEWVEDPAGFYSGGAKAAIDPERILRGGSWNSDGFSTRTARRFFNPPGTARDDAGFRVVHDACSEPVSNYPPPTTCIFPQYCFDQGPKDGEEGVEPIELPRHQVTLEPFNIGIYEVTNSEFAQILNYALGRGLLENSSGDPYTGGDVYLNGQRLIQIAPDTSKQPDPEFCDIEFNGSDFVVIIRDGMSLLYHPVNEVSWFGALAYCTWLSEAVGMEASYDLDTWTRIPGTTGFRLPTESEWEYAAAWDIATPGKAVDTKADCPGYHWTFGYSSDMPSFERANHFMANPLGLTGPPYSTPVGYYNGSNPGTESSISPYGLFDMSGNVYEWVENPAGPYPEPGDGSDKLVLDHVARGGSWYVHYYSMRTAHRLFVPPNVNYEDFGFRVARDGCDYYYSTPDTGESAE